MLDLTVALNCLRFQRESGTYRGSRIGRITEEADPLGIYRPGQIVLFKEEVVPGYEGEQKVSRTVTVESPKCPQALKEARKEGSLISVVGTMINFPRRYVEEVRIE